MTLNTTQSKTGPIEARLSFGGFYEGSYHGGLYDGQLEGYKHQDGEPANVGICSECEDNPKWETWRDEAGRAILQHLADREGVALEFIGVWSPSEYNYRTDEIDATIERDQFEALAGFYGADSEFLDWVREEIKGGPGYSSGYFSVQEVLDDEPGLVRYIFRHIVNLIEADEQQTMAWIYAPEDVTIEFDGCDCYRGKRNVRRIMRRIKRAKRRARVERKERAAVRM